MERAREMERDQKRRKRTPNYPCKMMDHEESVPDVNLINSNYNPLS
jgi:hypothetical protein